MAKHKCAIGGCDKLVDVEWCLCQVHWRVTPDHLRFELVRAYDRSKALIDQAPGFYRARAVIEAWIRETFGAEDKQNAKPSWNQVVAMVRERDAAQAARRPAPSSSHPVTPPP